MAYWRRIPRQMQAATETVAVAPASPVAQKPAKPRARMMRQYDLVERVRSYNPDTNEDLLNRAYVYAMKAHGTQTRASGDPYFSHPLEVAAILTNLKLDDATIVAALLHDTIEDTEATRAEIDTVFGHEIGALVEGLTKLKRLELVSREAKQAENLRKLLLAIADDVRVLLIKLADRLHNMRTLEFVPPASRRRIAEETLDIYAPLAGRMGMQEMREELEDLSFHVLDPEAYAVVKQRLDALAERNRNLIGEIETQLSRNLQKNGITARVYGRRKRPFSIWTKMERKSIGFEQLSDIYGFRVILDDVGACYRALGVVHTTWPVVPGRFKDYISTPKQNDYRSLHTTVIGPGQQRVELQNGDEVEVLTSQAQSAPPSAWEALAVTGKARAAIRRATRTAVRDQYAGLGRRIVDRLFARAKIEYADDKLKGALPRLARTSIEEVMASVGRGELKASDVARAMYPDYKEERLIRYGGKKTLAGKLKLQSPPHPARAASVIPVRGINSDLPVKFAPNGGAVPGDRIVGIVTPGEGITIYPIQAPALKDFEEEPERWLDVRWDIDETMPQRFPARILVHNVNEPGSLAQVATVIAEHDGNIDNISMSRRSPDFTELTIDLEVYDLKHLSAIIAQLRAKAVVARVERVNG